MTSPDVSSSLASIGTAFDSVVDFALDIFVNNVTLFVLFAMLGLGIGLFAYLLNNLCGYHSSNRKLVLGHDYGNDNDMALSYFGRTDKFAEDYRNENNPYGNSYLEGEEEGKFDEPMVYPPKGGWAGGAHLPPWLEERKVRTYNSEVSSPFDANYLR